jgi:MFS transporter, ACS family, glucarate transporter
MIRLLIVAALAILSWITYLDRAAISSVKEPVAAELRLDDKAMGAAFSSFALGYALGQIPTGWLADRLGPRVLLTAVVILWSLLTGLTGFVSTFTSLLLVRFFFGLAEAGAYPGTARAFYSWLPASERGRANGIVFAASRLGAALAFPLMAWLVAHYSWRATFYLLAAPGLIWGALWFLFYRERAGAKEKEAKEAAHGGLTLREALRTTAFRLALFQYVVTNFTTFLCLSWMNPYLKQRYALSAEEAASYSTIPLLVAATAQWTAGYTVDKLFQSQYREHSRSLPAIAGFVIAAVGAFAIPFAESPLAAAAYFALASFGVEVTISPAWSFCMDLGGRHSGAVSGAMNTCGNLGSFVSANAFPWIQGAFGSAGPYFYLLAALNLLSALAWTRIRVASGKVPS